MENGDALLRPLGGKAKKKKIQFNKIAILCNISKVSLIKYKFTLPTIDK